MAKRNHNRNVLMAKFIKQGGKCFYCERVMVLAVKVDKRPFGRSATLEHMLTAGVG